MQENPRPDRLRYILPRAEMGLGVATTLSGAITAADTRRVVELTKEFPFGAAALIQFFSELGFPPPVTIAGVILIGVGATIHGARIIDKDQRRGN